MSRYLDGLEQGAKTKFDELEVKINKLEAENSSLKIKLDTATFNEDNPLLNITLDTDEIGIWLIHETEEGPEQMGHISWYEITRRIQDKLLQEQFLIALQKIDVEGDLL